jgi:thioredoxin reductase (NADPH)
VKHWLLPDFMAQVEAGTIRFLAQTSPIAIDTGGVLLAHTDDDGQPTAEQFYYPTDFVLLGDRLSWRSTFA